MEYWVEWCRQRNAKVLGKKSIPVQLRPQTPYELPWYLTRAFIVRGRRLTASTTEGMRWNRFTINAICETVDVYCAWNVMAHMQKPDFVFRRNGRVHFNRCGRQFSRLLAAEVCASALVMLDTPCTEVVWRILATHSIRQFPLHFPSRASTCAITLQLDSTYVFCECIWRYQKLICKNSSFHLATDIRAGKTTLSTHAWFYYVTFIPRYDDSRILDLLSAAFI